MSCGECALLRSGQAQLKYARFGSFRLKLIGSSDSELFYKKEDRREEPLGKQEVDSLENPQAKLAIEWKYATYYAYHWLLGPIIIELNHDRENRGIIRAIDSEDGFFPASNENHLFFTIYLPRFHLQFRNEQPVVNSSVIMQIPPLHSTYLFNIPMEFKSNSWFPYPLKLSAGLIDTLTEGNLDLHVNDTSQHGKQFHVDFSLSNLSGIKKITVVWFLTGTLNKKLIKLYSRVQLKEKPVRIQAIVNMEQFKGDARFSLRAGILEPFGLCGAAVQQIEQNIT